MQAIAFQAPKAYLRFFANPVSGALPGTVMYCPGPRTHTALSFMTNSPDQNTHPSPLVWLQDRVAGKIRRKRFGGYCGEVRCDAPEDFARAIADVERLRGEGKHLAGFISYEAGYLTESTLAPLMPERRDVPLIWMGVFTSLEEEMLEAHATARGEERVGTIEDLTPELDHEAYCKAVEQTLDYIAAGDIYQANVTYRSAFSWTGNPVNLFDALTRTQPVPYAAYIDTGKEVVLSLSPELFFDISGDTIRARPMKGTSKRGRTTAEDAVLSEALANDPKERAENLMILDLMRNDLSRLAKPGSVHVPDRFTVERYRTVLQMTSSVEAKLKPGIDFPAMLDALFPCGSVTGAPKVRAMEVISQLERSPRGVYTGAIGHLAPNGDAAFNVAIRTLTLKPDANDRGAWTGSVGVGGGIVYDSTPQREYDECQVKIAFLDKPDKEPIQLIETMRVEAGEIYLLDEHMARLKDSAHYFDFPCQIEKIKQALMNHTAPLGSGNWRLRLLLSADGSVSLTEAPLAARPSITFSIARPCISSNDTFVFHKTTRRTLYDDTLTAESARCDVDEVLFLNERGELAEGSRSNLFLRRGDVLLTPPLASGCLPGSLRAHLLSDPDTQIVEEVLSLADLETADAIYFGNSVRGLELAHLATQGAKTAPALSVK